MIPIGLIVVIPCPLGSGKSGSPWERMHSVYLRALAAISAGVRLARPGGTSFWQAFEADWNCGVGDRGLIPGSTLKAKPPPGEGTGSGKSLSPWARMHPAYFSNCTSVGPDELEELEPAGALDWVVVVLACPPTEPPTLAEAAKPLSRCERWAPAGENQVR
jgi:hypothetical protein